MNSASAVTVAGLALAEHALCARCQAWLSQGSASFTSHPLVPRGAVTCLSRGGGGAGRGLSHCSESRARSGRLHAGHQIACPGMASNKPCASTCICLFDSFTCTSLPGSPVQGKLKGAHWTVFPGISLPHRSQALSCTSRLPMQASDKSCQSQRPHPS